MPTDLFEATAVLSGAFLSGSMLSICFVTVPPMLEAARDAAQLQAQWQRLFHYGHYIMPAMAVGTGVLHSFIALGRARAKKPWQYAVLAGLATVSIAPFTWIFMAKTNTTLFALESQALTGKTDLDRVKRLVVTWTWLHFVRSMLPIAGTMTAALATF